MAEGSGIAAPPVLRYVEREARIYQRLWRGNAFSQFAAPVLYLLAMGVGLGSLIDAGGTRIDGLTYLEFVAPGLMAATVVQGATGESLWPVMAGHKWMGFYHAMVAAPMRAADVYLGNLSWIAVRFGASATAFLVVAAALGGVLSPWGVLAVPAAVLGALAVAAPLTAFAVTQETDSRFPLILRFVTLPMFLFSATFFPITQLPPWMQPLAWATPLWHSVTLCRMATTGTVGDAGVSGILAHLAVLAAYIGVGMLLGIRAFTRRLTT